MAHSYRISSIETKACIKEPVSIYIGTALEQFGHSALQDNVSNLSRLPSGILCQRCTSNEDPKDSLWTFYGRRTIHVEPYVSVNDNSRMGCLGRG